MQVVTAIIRRDSDGKLLLVKRSDQVSMSAAAPASKQPVLCSWHAPKLKLLAAVLAAVPAGPLHWSSGQERSLIKSCCAVLSQVGSYQQYWGGVSGGVEGNESLLHRALQEVSSCDANHCHKGPTATAAAAAAAAACAVQLSLAAHQRNASS